MEVAANSLLWLRLPATPSQQSVSGAAAAGGGGLLCCTAQSVAPGVSELARYSAVITSSRTLCQLEVWCVHASGIAVSRAHLVSIFQEPETGTEWCRQDHATEAQAAL